MDAIALPPLWTMKIKLIFLAEKLCLIAFITVNIKELLYDSVGSIPCAYCFLTFALAVVETAREGFQVSKERLESNSESNAFVL